MESTAPLSGVRIVDFTFQGAGPYTTMLLAALGADVVKIESTRRPDPTRGRENRPYLRSLLFDDVNAGKRSISVDMKSNDGAWLIRQLVARSAALVDNFRPGVMAAWGLTRDALAVDNPRLVTASLSALGATGPLSRLPGYAGIFNALSGLGDLTGYEGGPPTELRTSVDMRAGAFFAVGVVHGLLQARLTGQGTHIDFSAAESISALCGEHMAAYGLLGQVPERIGNADESYRPHGVYSCADHRWVAVAIRDAEDWTAFAAEASEGAARSLSREDPQAERELATWLARRPASEAVITLRRAGIPVGQVQDAADLWNDEQLRSRKFFTESRLASGKDRVIAAAPWLREGRRPPVAPGPELGAHTDEVLHTVLELSDEEIARLRVSGALT